VRFSANPDDWATDWNGILCVFTAGCLGIAVGIVSAQFAADSIGRLVHTDDMQVMWNARQEHASKVVLASHDRVGPAQPQSANGPAPAWGDD
jgi:hypothetical protein